MHIRKAELVRNSIAFVAVAAMAAIHFSANAQTPLAAPGTAQPTILYGAAYYNEYMPADLQPGRLDKDVALMKASGHHRGAHGRIDVEPVGTERRAL